MIRHRSKIQYLVQYFDLLSNLIIIYELRVMLNSVLDTCSVLLGTLNQPLTTPVRVEMYESNKRNS
jgi:hypothetical protein